MTGYEAFSLYESLKLHFSKDTYDFFKYNGKTNISVSTFENRKDKYHFYKLSRKYTNRDDLILFIASNIVEKQTLWVGDLLAEEAEVNFRKRQKVLQSLSYTFENDCKLIFDDCKLNPNELLRVIDGEHPALLKRTMRKEIQIETVCILNKILNFLPVWKSKIADTIIWPMWQMKMTKYTPFLPQDVVKYKLILKKVLHD